MSARFLSLILGVGLLAGLLGQGSIRLSGAADIVPPPYKEGAPPGMTGGFGDLNCHSCHFEQTLDDPRGYLEVLGIPDRYEPDSTYAISVALSRPDLGAAGFAFTVRSDTNSPAGELPGTAERVRLASAEGTAPYLTHTETGAVTDGDTASWAFRWIAPTEGVDKIVFNLAANAANGDDSEFGDWIYVFEKTAIPNLTRSHDE